MKLRLILFAVLTLIVGSFFWQLRRPDTPNYTATDLPNVGVVSGADALSLLKAGNSRFVAGQSRHPHESNLCRSALLEGQHPIAVVVGCSDSRVPPDLLFDCGFGDLFVIRVAGNVVDTDELASIEYALDHLDTKLVVVLGHTGCGAVTAALDEHLCDDEPKEICDLIAKIRKNIGNYESLSLDQAVEQNVMGTTTSVQTVSDIESAIADRSVLVQPAIYHMDTGAVEWID